MTDIQLNNKQLLLIYKQNKLYIENSQQIHQLQSNTFKIKAPTLQTIHQEPIKLTTKN